MNIYDMGIREKKKNCIFFFNNIINEKRNWLLIGFFPVSYMIECDNIVENRQTLLLRV